MKFVRHDYVPRPEGVTDEQWAMHRAQKGLYDYENPSEQVAALRAQIETSEKVEEAEARPPVMSADITAMAGVEVATVDITE